MTWKSALGVLYAVLVATTAFAQAPQIISATPDRSTVRAGEFVRFTVRARAGTIGAAPLVATFDPNPIAESTFVEYMNQDRTSEGCRTPESFCFSGVFTVSYRAQPGPRQTFSATVTDAVGRATSIALEITVEPPRDDDRDGLPDGWEVHNGLYSNNGGGAHGPDGDPDGDGVSNREEFETDGHAIGRHRSYFAEASTGDRQLLESCFSFEAPDRVGALHQPPPVDGRTSRIKIVGDDGRSHREYLTAYNWNVCPLRLNRFVADRVVSVTIESPFEIAVERITSLGKSSEVTAVAAPIAAPSSTWYFADAATRSPLDLFYLLYNPNDTLVEATFTYLPSDGRMPIRKTRLLPPAIRTTVWANVDDPELRGVEVATIVHATAPILIERAWRYNAPGRTVPQEAATPGAPSPSLRWYFADPDPGGSFDAHLVFANPFNRPAQIELTFLFADREPTVARTSVPALSRRQFSLRDVAGVSSVVVRSTNLVPIVAERSWGGVTASGEWRQAAVGATQSHVRWGFSTNLRWHDTDLIVTNVSATDALVELHFFRQVVSHIETPEIRTTIQVPAHRRMRIRLGPGTTMPGAGSFVITSLPSTGGVRAGIVVERVTYFPDANVPRARATSVLGTPLTP